MEPKPNVQELIYQFRILKEQRDWLASQLELYNASLSNTMVTKTTLENLKNVKQDEEILIPIGGIANIKAKIVDTENVIVNISQGVAIQKNLDASIEFIDKIIEQHNEQITFLSSQIQQMDANLQGMSNQFQKNVPTQ
ncbi:MAG: prefoldin subunit alpha [Candidatus Hermodarchaeota archaeon]